MAMHMQTRKKSSRKRRRGRMESLERGSLTDPAQRFFKRGKRKKRTKTNTQKNKKTKNCTERIMSRYLDKYANLPAWCPFHLLYLRPPSSLGSRRSIAFSLALPLLHPSLIFFSLFFCTSFFSPHFLCKLGVSRNYCNALSSLESNPIRRLFSYLCVVRDLFRRKRWWCKGSFWSNI